MYLIPLNCTFKDNQGKILCYVYFNTISRIKKKKGVQCMSLTYFLMFMAITEDKIRKADVSSVKTMKPVVCAQQTPGPGVYLEGLADSSKSYRASQLPWGTGGPPGRPCISCYVTSRLLASKQREVNSDGLHVWAEPTSD